MACHWIRQGTKTRNHDREPRRVTKKENHDREPRIRTKAVNEDEEPRQGTKTKIGVQRIRKDREGKKKKKLLGFRNKFTHFPLLRGSEKVSPVLKEKKKRQKNYPFSDPRFLKQFTRRLSTV